MSQSGIYTDVERLKEVIGALPIFANDLQVGLNEMMASFHALGSTWRDDEYERFKKCLEPLRRTIDEMRQELSRLQISLQTDVDNLVRYNQIQL